jgi:cytochrome c-type biogenesis protein CcmH
LVRERLVAGDTNEEVLAFVVDRYGEYVLLNPPATGANLILWVAGPLLLLAGLGISGAYLMRRGNEPAPVALSEDEKARLAKLLDD